jgi:hypothetical protein
MKKISFLCVVIFIAVSFVSASYAGDLPKIAVWDLAAGNLTPSYAQDLTSILVSEISKLKKYEVYSQENVRTLAGWTAERMTLGCTDTKCLTALGQMDIAKLISGRVGKIGNTYSISLNLFDTQNAKAEESISEFCRSEDQLIDLVQVAARKLLGVEVVPAKPGQPPPITATTENIQSSPVAISPSVKPKTEVFAGKVDAYFAGEKIRVLGKKEGSNTERYYKEFNIAPNASILGEIAKKASVRVFYYEQDGKPIATEIRAIVPKF